MAASIMAAPGSFSLGLRSMVFPHTVATGNIHKGIIAGKLKGQMPAVTPRGWRINRLTGSCYQIPDSRLLYQTRNLMPEETC